MSHSLHARLQLNDTGRVLVSVYGPAMIMSLGQGMVIPTIPALAGTFDVSAGLAAQLVTAGMLGRVLTVLPIGHLLDRYGRKPLLVGGPLLVAVASTLSAAAPVFPLLLFGQFLAGMGSSAWQAALELAAVDVVRPEQRGRVIAGFHGMHSVGVAVGPVMGGLLTDLVGFRAVFWVYALLSLCIMAVSVRVRETAQLQRTARPGLLSVGRVSEVEPYFRTTYVVLVVNTFVAMMRGSRSFASAHATRGRCPHPRGGGAPPPQCSAPVPPTAQSARARPVAGRSSAPGPAVRAHFALLL